MDVPNLVLNTVLKDMLAMNFGNSKVLWMRDGVLLLRDAISFSFFSSCLLIEALIGTQL